jgi:hypothetical protein
MFVEVGLARKVCLKTLIHNRKGSQRYSYTLITLPYLWCFKIKKVWSPYDRLKCFTSKGRKTEQYVTALVRNAMLILIYIPIIR